MRRDARTLAAAYIGMGAHASVVPALLPTWAERSDDGVLAAVPALFGGLFAGVLASVPLLAGAPPARVLRWSAGGQALTLLALAAAGRALVPGSTGLVVGLCAASGVAFGVTESAVSVAARAATGTDRSLGRLLSLSAATAALLPVVVLVAGRVGAGAAVLVLAATAPLLVALRRDAVEPGAEPLPARPVRWRDASAFARLAPVLLPAAAGLALYVGVETLLSGWSAVLVHDLLGTDASTAALGASAFWLLMSAGRLWGARSVGGGLRVRAATAAGLFAIAAASTSAPTIVLVACAVTVVVVAPAYPRLLGSALDGLDARSAARWTGPLVAVGAAGGGLLPALALATGPVSGSGTFVVAGLACLTLAMVVPSRPRAVAGKNTVEVP